MRTAGSAGTCAMTDRSNASKETDVKAMPRLDQSDAARARGANLFLVATGTLSTAHLPFWLNWLSANRPRYKVTVGLTDSAEHFVSASALATMTGTPVVSNTWETASGRREPVHTRIAADYDGIIVFPASVAFLSGLASGAGTSPFFLAALGTAAPVVIAPSFPPGVAQNPIIADVLARLAGVPNYHLIEPQKGTSRSTGAETEVTAPLWDAIATFEAATTVAPDTETATATAPVNA
ncbi:phosphopantothenoylcysteine decarboxylase [Streptomyces jumonjinensis]|uniref:Phosphopantothenoylcysteine decarboxylase n=2 Tax=Streptomyces jumonjinensis TaxID=1945 RepID=A0A646KCG9_STRJU|nr:phosphopantothenoylcysteine decarboxylase [Streptomyces jumonjinensis]